MEGFVNNFCVSYVAGDERWGEWVAWVIGHHFSATAAENALSDSLHRRGAVQSGLMGVVPILSPASIDSAEAAAWQRVCTVHPGGRNAMGVGIIVPILVEKCEVTAPLGSLPLIDLTGFSAMDEATVTQFLFNSMLTAVSPRFPGPS